MGDRKRRTTATIRLVGSMQEYEVEVGLGPVNDWAEHVAARGFWRETREGRVYHPGHQIAAIRVNYPKPLRGGPRDAR